MVREWFAGRAVALERRDVGCFGGGLLSRQLVLGGSAFQFFEFEFHLVEQARCALRTGAVLLALELLDLQFQMRDEGVIIGALGLFIGELGGHNIGSSDAGKQGCLQRSYVIRQRGDINSH